MEIIQHVQNIQYRYLLNKYKMGHVKGNFMPVPYMERKVPEGYGKQEELLLVHDEAISAKCTQDGVKFAKCRQYGCHI